MTQWTRKDFVDLADAIKVSSQMITANGYIPLPMEMRWDELVGQIIHLCRERNPRFDEDRFRGRAGLGDKR